MRLYFLLAWFQSNSTHKCALLKVFKVKRQGERATIVEILWTLLLVNSGRDVNQNTYYSRETKWRGFQDHVIKVKGQAATAKEYMNLIASEPLRAFEQKLTRILITHWRRTKVVGSDIKIRRRITPSKTILFSIFYLIFLSSVCTSVSKESVK